ncbi:MAG: hypothetical protein M0Q95_05115 [Porticoccaceae bacterium]|jgi:hypothetical protein|nr:hypothetical protein [Porticoccaceae bacterium]|tara:strand:- start:1468 stop:1917 length:450 start_codon:yes stop_codon:yes gene_type:complete
MQIKTLEDVLHWTTAYHELLSDSLAHAVERAENGAVSLLLDYLAKHESTLAQLIRLLEQTADAKTLSTLCSEYLDSRPVFQYHQRNEDLAELTINDIATKLVREHQQLIELYRFLYWRAETGSAQDLLKQLLMLEEHQAMKMNQAVNRS